MDALTAKTNEIRRLHAVCRAKDDAVRQAYQEQVRRARSEHHVLLHCGRFRDNDAYETRRILGRELRDQYMHAARVLKEILKDVEG